MPTVKKQTVKPVRKPLGGTVLDRISDIDFGDHIGLKLNIYGRSASGKTTFWSTFPKPILAIICSGGQHPGELRSIPKKLRSQVKQVILQKSDEVSELAKTGLSDYATVVLDHASGLQDMVLKEVLGLDEAPVQLSWGLASQQQYGQIALQMKERLRSLLDLPQHVVIVAQEREFSGDGDNSLLVPFVGSALIPSVTGWLAPACDYICQTFVRGVMEEKKVTIAGKTTTVKSAVAGKVEYCLRTAPHEIYQTKFRLPKGTPLPPEIVDPSFEKLMALING